MKTKSKLITICAVVGLMLAGVDMVQGLTTTGWTEYGSNPVYNPGKAYYPTILKEESIYKMWSDSATGVQMATSTNGVSWTTIGSVSGLLNPRHTVVEKIGSEYRMWYNDSSRLYGIQDIRTATSSDGLTWSNDQAITQVGTTVVSGTWPAWNTGSYGACDILYNPAGSATIVEPVDKASVWANKFVMYYDGTTGGDEFLGLAVSNDGINWQGYNNGIAPVLDSSPTGWDSGYVGFGTVIKESDDIFHLWYSGGSDSSLNNGIGYASSTDGITWVKDTGNPIFHKSDGVDWRDKRTYTPMVIGNEMWFTGVDIHGSGVYSIGYATPEPVPTTWDVATVNGQNQFTISPDSSSLHYNPQGWTDYVWYENNGSLPGTIATTTAGPHAPLVDNRSGMRTFATTDVAVGQKLRDLKLVFEYKNSLGGYPTINFFMTDGSGKFGIFAPTSLGIGVVGGIEVLDADWSRMTINLTQTSIPDTTNVAVYEHNGLAADKIYPFTTMQWGDIKDLYIAGVYDYQRSPTNGWGYWGKMFDQINIAGNATIVNGHGLALIWGDTANSSNAYGLAAREIRNVTVSFGGTDYTGTFANEQYTNVLKLDVQADPVYLQPGESVTIDMDALALAQEVFGCQAVLNFSSTYFIATQTGPGSPIVAPGGGVWDELIYSMWNAGGDLDVAVGVDFDLPTGTQADGTVAKFTLTANNIDGTTKMVFRADGEDPYLTAFSDNMGQFVYPGSKIVSQDIVIDGTAPTMDSISPDEGACVSGVKDFVFDFNDANPLQQLELDIVGPAPYNTAPSRIQVTFPAGPLTDPVDLARAASMGVSVVYDAVAQKWTVSVDTTTTWNESLYGPNPYGISDGGKVYPDGAYAWYIQVNDVAGNHWGDMYAPTPEATRNWTFDNTAPTISSASVTPSCAKDSVTISASATDLGCAGGTLVYNYSIDGGTPVTFTSPVVVDITGLAQGGHSVVVTVTDGNGNTATSDVLSFSRDSVAPTIISASVTPLLAKDSVTISASATDLGCAGGTLVYSYSIDGGTPVTFTSPVVVDITGLDQGDHSVVVTVTDGNGNTATSDTLSFSRDSVAPTIGITDDLGTNPVLQGTYTITVTASDAIPSSGLDTPPIVRLDSNILTATSGSGAGPWTYTVVVDSSTANGVHTITADINDLAGNPAIQATRTFTVNKTQVTGQVQLQNFVGASRTVVFIATGGVANKTWAQTLSFTGGIASFTLTDVPSGTTNLSAKTNWNLRSKVAVGGGTDDQWTADLTGASKLLGGDLNNSNTVNILDYSTLKRFWYTTNPIADIDGSGTVSLSDYVMLQGNFFKTGSPQ